MKHTILSLFIFATLFIGCKSSDVAMDGSDAAAMMEAAPSPQEIIIQEHIAALGGMEALGAITSIKSTGEVEMPAMDMTLLMTSYNKAPGKLYIEIDIPQMGAQVLNGFDGETAWEVNPMAGGATKLGEDRALAFREQADMDGYLVGAPEAGFTVTYLGDEDLQEKMNHKFQLMRADSTDLTLFLDAETKMQSMIEVSGPNPMTGVMGTIRTYMSDYRTVGGVPMPYRMSVEIDGEVFQTLTFKDIKVNTPIADSLFLYPGE